jgi:hypothetical protein
MPDALSKSDIKIHFLKKIQTNLLITLTNAEFHRYDLSIANKN